MESISFEKLFTEFMAQVEAMIDFKVNERIARIQNSKTEFADKEFYSLKEVSHITGITFLALKGRKKRGTLKCANEGNVTLVSKDELHRLLDRLNRQLGKK